MTIVAAGPTTLWYVARGSGLACLLLLTASVVLGIVTTARWSNERWPRFAVSMVHRNVSLLAVVFLGMHIATMVLDGFAPIGWKDAVLPFASPYRAVWLGLGALAFDLLVAVIVTSFVRKRIGNRAWRIVHWLSYPLWALAVVHGLGTGTDTRTAPLLIANAACVIAVGAAVWWRCTIARSARPALRGTAFAAIVILPVALVAWLLTGPLTAGWARRAGTPSALLAGATASRDGLGSDFDAGFRATVTEAGRGPSLTVAVDGQLDRGASGTLAVSLDAEDDGAGSLLVRDGTVKVVDAAGRTVFAGTVSSVRDGVVFATPGEAGSPRQLAIEFDSFDTRAGTASGTVRAVSGPRDS